MKKSNKPKNSKSPHIVNSLFLLKAIFKSKKIWRSPKKSEILLFDNIGEPILKSIFKGYSYTTLDCRWNYVIIPKIISAIFRTIFHSENFAQAYFYSAISKVNPKIVVTFADNNEFFFTISKKFSNLKTVIIQNGTRAKSEDIFGSLNTNSNNFVDYMCVHNDNIADLYSKFIQGETLVIGSLLNNSLPISSQITPDVVTLISMYKPKTHLPIKINTNKDKISWEDRNIAEINLVRWLDNWCYENNKFLKVIGRGENPNIIAEELEFYSKLIVSSKFEYVTKTNLLFSYITADEAEIVVSMGSTLGYEMLSRGKKVAIFNFLSKVYKDSSFSFGWPASFSTRGPFWTDEMDPKQVWQILDYVHTVSLVDWNKLIYPIQNQIMKFDSDNKLLKSLLSDIL